jgi:hypothetical protein
MRGAGEYRRQASQRTAGTIESRDGEAELFIRRLCACAAALIAEAASRIARALMRRKRRGEGRSGFSRTSLRLGAALCRVAACDGSRFGAITPQHGAAAAAMIDRCAERRCSIVPQQNAP